MKHVLNTDNISDSRVKPFLIHWGLFLVASICTRETDIYSCFLVLICSSQWYLLLTDIARSRCQVTNSRRGATRYRKTPQTTKSQGNRRNKTWYRSSSQFGSAEKMEPPPQIGNVFYAMDKMECMWSIVSTKSRTILSKSTEMRWDEA